MGVVAYELNLPQGSQIHPVFNVSQLRKRVGTGQTVIPVLPLIHPMQQTKEEPEGILGRRMIKRKNDAVPQILIKWLNKDIEEASWEDYEEIKEQFPAFILRDKDEFEKGGVSASDQQRLLAVENIDLVNIEEEKGLEIGRNGQKRVNSSLRLSTGPGQAGSATKASGQLNDESLGMGPRGGNVNNSNDVKETFETERIEPREGTETTATLSKI